MESSLIQADSLQQNPAVSLMEEQELPHGYVAGILDAKGSIDITFDSKATYAVGYFPEVRLTVTSTEEAMIGLLDAYAEALGVRCRVSQQGSDERLVWIVVGPEQVATVLHDVYHYLIEQADKATFYLDEIIPFVESGEWKSGEGLVKLAEMVKTAGGKSRRRKYTPDYFCDEFGIEG